GCFEVHDGSSALLARSVVLATGVVDVEPDLPNLQNAIRRGLIRHCPICDGWEVIDQRVGVIGYGATALSEALFIRRYTPDITVFTLGKPLGLSERERALLADAGIRVIETPVIEAFVERNALVGLKTIDQSEYRFDTLYSALGARARSDLAAALGVVCSDRRDHHPQRAARGRVARLDQSNGRRARSVERQADVVFGEARRRGTRAHHVFQLRALQALLERILACGVVQ